MKAQKMASYGVQDALDSVLERNEDSVEELQAGQMFSGKRADGSRIAPAYADSTKKLKAKKGQPFDRVTLRDKKDFHDAIEAKYSGGQFAYFVTSNDFKTKYLVARYRADIFGLNDDFLDGLFVLIVDDSIASISNTFRTI